MTEVIINVPKDMYDLVSEADKAIYIETLKEVAFKRMRYRKKELDDLKKKINSFESKYLKSYEDFMENVPDTIQGHDDWIEWTYLKKAADELSSKIDKLSLLMGE